MIIQIKSDLGSFIRKHKIEKNENLVSKVGNNTLSFLGFNNKVRQSRYDYKLKTFYFKYLGYVFISIISLLTLLPLAYYIYSKEKYNNTFYDNKKVKFDGNVSSVYITFVSNFILVVIIITLVNAGQTIFLSSWLDKFRPVISNLIRSGINALPTILLTSYLLSVLYKWGQNNTHFLWSNSDSYMELNIIGALLSSIIRKIFLIITFGLGIPFIIWNKMRYLINRQYISGKRLVFKGTIRSAYGWFLFRFYLIFLTFGLYFPIFLYKLNQWIIMNTHIKE